MTLAKAILSALFSLVVLSVQANVNSISEQLRELDELRLKNRTEFTDRLASLKASTNDQQISEHDKHKLSLLSAWDLVIKGDFNQALQLAEGIEQRADRQLAIRASSLIVNIHTLSFKYIDAFAGVEKLLSYAVSINDEHLYYQTIGQVILLYSKIERYEQIQQLISHGLKITRDTTLRCRLQALGLQSLYHSVPFNEYQQTFNEISELCEATTEAMFNLLIIRNHMFYLLEQQQAAAALAFYQQYYSQVEQINYPILTAGFNAAAAEALLQQGELAAASELAQRAEQSLPGDRNDPAVLSTYRVLTLLAQAERNFDNLLRYSEKRRDTELAIAREKASQQLAYQLASGEARLKEQRIQLLDKDNELLTLERNLYQQQAENRYLMLLLIGSLSLILGLLTYRGLTRSKRYRKMAEFDQLTGISNRYHFTEQAQREIAHCIRAQRPVALILFDLDHFKQINDRFGHAAGDWTLQQVVLSCRNFIRHSDIFGRIGGEEFVILLTDCTAEQAVMLADICRTALADIDTSGYQPKFKVTASFGISDSQQAGYDLSALLAAADAAMYQAKQQGRNQVYCPATADGARAC
ncbi:sensor domain-containing diguanylate cyclase [Alishewanella jeotgali]|uniref:diguanylate cyclase n=1 Tax=Alishewanella jeotgali KCTC 22429 TaxID=1129374 RepID=H3ZCY2_9ALTE|nr:GGDEF domain-containing protein [Alishewanella jeotgali]EHR41571.1 diguanylate cyclase [Alishewanella jeotgali KCTC 22429]